MKKLTIILALLINCSLFALPLGNPWEGSLMCDGESTVSCFLPDCNWTRKCSDWFQLKFGFYGDYVFNRHLEIAWSSDESDIRSTQLITNAAMVAVNFCDWFDVFVTLGGTSMEMESPERSFFPSNANTNAMLFLETETGFSWSVGARGVLWGCGNFAIGTEGQYFSTKPNLNTIFDPIGATLQTYPTGVHFDYSEAQVGFAATYQICLSRSIQALPYAGLTFSHAWASFGDARESLFQTDDGAASANGNVLLRDMKNQHLVGYAVGLTIAGCERFTMTVEGMFAGESGLYVNSVLKF